VTEDVLEPDSLDLVWMKHLADQIGSARMDCPQFGAIRNPQVSNNVVFCREGQFANKDDEHNTAELPDGDAVLKVTF